ncbi:MAG: hypothetical protein U0T77_08575 [Chitinophagales bacterium]
MGRLFTLRNIIPLLILFILAGCQEGNYSNNFNYQSDLQTFSSEDKNDIPQQVGEVIDPETGRVAYKVVRK